MYGIDFGPNLSVEFPGATVISAFTRPKIRTSRWR
jgi:hypothetical protein